MNENEPNILDCPLCDETFAVTEVDDPFHSGYAAHLQDDHEDVLHDLRMMVTGVRDIEGD